MEAVTRVWTDEEVARIWRDQRYRAAFERLGIPYPDPPVPYVKADLFEEWLIERWLREVRSDSFRETAEYHYLLAEWERGQ